VSLFSHHFMVNAMEAGTIVGVVAGAMGWFMVLRCQSFAGHTLAVVTFPGAAGAVLIGVSAVYGYFSSALAAALIIALVGRGPAGYGRESALIGTVQAFALASGALFVSLYGGFLNSTTALLFGSFLGISDIQVLTLLVVGGAVLLALAGIARPLFFATVDPDVARARGVPVRLISVLFLVLLGAAAAEVSQVTGALLIFALLVMPAAAAQRLTTRPACSVLLSVLLAVVIAWAGLVAAYYSVYPVGFYVTSFGFAAYLLGSAARTIRPLTGTGAM